MLALAISAILLLSIAPALGQTMTTSTTTFADDTGLTVPRGWLALDDNNLVIPLPMQKLSLVSPSLQNFVRKTKVSSLRQAPHFAKVLNTVFTQIDTRILLQILIFALHQ
jgi:hypothetical protein